MSNGLNNPGKGKGPPETPPGQDKPKPPHGPPHVPPGQAKKKKKGDGALPPLPFPSDLTRWNRAGLSRFEYIDGNAAHYLELLRQALALRFPDRWDALRTRVPEDLDEEPEGDRLERLLEQYLRERGDWGWEIARVLARVCHVLTGHLDVYANEGYLGTATQWDNVRRLVEMLDYSPAPPASATARLVLHTKGEGGTVEKGFQVQHTPPDGGAPVIFETLEDLEVDPDLDALRPVGWNRSPRRFQEMAPADPSSQLAARPCLDLQGVGPAYAGWLDKLRQLDSGDPEARFRIADFRDLVPEKLPPFAFGLSERPDQLQEVLRLRLREFKGKADVLLDFPWSASEVTLLLDWTLAELLAADAADLALHSARSAGEMERLQDDLRLVEIVLDQPVFNATRLRKLVAGGEDGSSGDEGSSGEGAVPSPGSPWIAPEKSKISAVDLGLVIRDPGTAEAVVVQVDRVDPLTRAVILGDVVFQQPWRHWTRGETSLAVKAGFLRRPRLNGPDVVTFENPHDLNPGEVVAWKDDTWSFARVAESDERAVRLTDGSLPGPATEIYRAFAIERVEDELLFPFRFKVAARWTAAGLRKLQDDEYSTVPPNGEEDDQTEDQVAGAKYSKLEDKTADEDLTGVMEIFLVPDGAAPVGRITAVPAGEFVFDGKPGKLGSGQWAVADDGKVLWPVKIESITEREDHFLIAFEPSATPPFGAGRRPVGDLPCIAIQGVGTVYSGDLGEAGIDTLAQLHELTTAELADLGIITPVRLWEIKTKADFLFGMQADPEELAPIADHTLDAALALPTEELAGLLSKSTAAAEELKDHLRTCEACLDESSFRELTVRDLLPEEGDDGGGGTGSGLPDRLVRLYGLFKHTLRPTGWNRNDTPLTGDRIVLDLTELEDEKVPGLLIRGRNVVLEQEVLPEGEETGNGDDVTYTGAVATQIEEVDDSDETAPAVVLDLTSPLNGFTLGNAVLRGNVVQAGHGEKKPEKVLGSGDAARSNQRFVLAEEGVSFVADATQPSGVRADITVRVEDRAWQQVANLRDSGPADAHYAVRMTEDGYLAIELGDGRHGRRLPTGGNNVRISFRVGTGLAGNLAAGSLVKAARPHRLVKSVRQPLAATGGNDMEDVRSLKENAPASVLTLERAVSVGDLGHLAARQSSVWQARAFSLPTGLSRRESVEVVVVPAGGGELGTLKESLQKTLQAHTLPGVDVQISAAEMTDFDVEATVRVKSAEYDPDQVVESVRQALLDAFSLERRRLGQDLFLSEVYQVVEGVQGVESSICTIDGDRALRRLDASNDEVFHLDSETSEIDLQYEEWSL